MKSVTRNERRVADAWFAEQVATAAAAATLDGPQVALVERSARAGVMAPLHRRDEDETYQVLEGEVTFFVGYETVPAGPGDVVVAPAGSVRTFVVESGEARWAVLTHVTSIARFVDFGRAVSAPLAPGSARWRSEIERATVASIGSVNGIEILGPPGVLPSVIAEH